jgi:hypothetical protein
MRSAGWWLVAAGMTVTAAGAVLLVVLPGHRAGVADAWLVAVAALGVVAGAVAARRAADLTRPLVPAGRPPKARRPADLERLERELLLVRVSGMHARQARLRLRQVAAARLAARHGIDLDADASRAAALLGPAVWALIDVGPPSAARDAPPMDLQQLRAAIEAVERK